MPKPGENPPPNGGGFDIEAYKSRIWDALTANVERSEKRESAKGKGPKRYSTDYAIAWGRKQGWKLIDRERFDFRTKRHYDCELGMDAVFDDGVDGRVGVQGAGRGQERAHRARFDREGGEQAAKRRRMRVVYLEFERGCQTPTKEVWWVGDYNG